MKLSGKFPPLYSCSVCGKAVKVISQGVGNEPIYEYHKKCPHRDVPIYANRKVTLRGKGQINVAQRVINKTKLSIRQFLSMLTGRSI